MAKYKEESKSKEVKSTDVPEKTEYQLKFEDNLRKAIDGQNIGCFWNKGAWKDRWDLQRKFGYFYYSEEDQSERYKSNVKSPEIPGRIQSALQKMNKFNLSFVSRPKRDEAKFSSEIAQLVLNEKFKKGQFRYRLKDAYMDLVTNGTALLGVDWLTMKREVEINKTNADQMTDEEIKAFKEKGTIPTTKVIMVDVDDVVLKNYRLENVFVDPSALNFNTGENRAGHAFVIEFISKDRFELIYKDKQGFKDTDKVCSVSPDYNEDSERDSQDSYLAQPKATEGDFVRIIKGYDYDHDRYCIKANDVFIYEGPLPYNDKKIPIAALKAIKAPYQFYGIGIPDLLIPIVTQIELLSNTVYDYAMYTANPMFAVQAGEYAEIGRKYALADGAPGTLLPVQDTQRSMLPIRYSPMTVDVYQALSQLQRDAVVASQQDPSQLGFMKKDSTATANLLNKEIVEAYIMSIVDTIQEDTEQVADMVVSRLHQFMTTKDVEILKNGEPTQEEENQKAQEAQYPTIPIEGMDVKIDWDTRSVKIKDAPNKISFVEMRPEIFKYTDKEGNLVEVTPNDFDISLSVESIEIMSRAMEKQEAGEMLAQLSPFMVDTSNPGKVAAHPMPLVDANTVMEEVFEKKGYNKKHLINYAQLEKDSISRAKAQNFEAMQGSIPMPHPGESREHLNIHSMFLKELIKRFESMKKDISSMIMPALEQGLGQPQIPEGIKGEFDTIKEAINLMSDHIMEDSMSPAMDAQQTAQKGKAMTQMQAPMPQGIGQSMTQSGLGGNQEVAAMGNPMQQGAMPGGPGQLGGQM